MRVFMLGWEFPPFISGGLGTDVMFVLPRPVSTPFSTHVRLVSPRPGSPLEAPSTEFRLDEFENVTFRTIGVNLSAYDRPGRGAQERAAEVLFIASPDSGIHAAPGR